MFDKKLATNLIPGDEITVNLVGTRPNGTRLSVVASFDHTGKRLNGVGQGLTFAGAGAGGDAPEFNQVAYERLINKGQHEAAEALRVQHEIALAEYETAGGGASITDTIRSAVLAWAEKTHGVTQKTREDGFVIQPEQVIVKNVMRVNGGPGIFAVSLTPAWGQR